MKKATKYGKPVTVHEYENLRGTGMTIQAECEVAGKDPTKGKPFQVFRVAREIGWAAWDDRDPSQRYKIQVRVLVDLANALRRALEAERRGKT